MNQRMARILCVDDDPLNLSLLEVLLSPRGYDVVLVANGPEALEKIRTERIDICLLDVMMPGMDGFEVCRRIKSDDLHRNIPVVMITSYADLDHRIRGIEAGAEDFISNPFDSGEVLARIKMLLHVKLLNDRLQSAYHNIAKLSAFGEQTIINFDPVTFDFLENVDSIVHQIIRSRFDQIDSPEIVVIGMTDQEGISQWLRYDSIGEDINRSTARMNLDCKLAFPVNCKPAVVFYNEADPDLAASTLVRELEKNLIPVSNMVSYFNDSFCLIALNYGREVTTHDATVINSVVMQSLFLKSLASQVRDTEYAENIVETVREPLVVLDSELKILTANRSFYDTFKGTPEDTIGNFIYDLGNRQWDIPKLRVLFEEILPFETVFNGYEVEHDFPGIGCKTILLNARQIFRENIGSRIILLAMEDITERKLAAAEIERLNVSLSARTAELETQNAELQETHHELGVETAVRLRAMEDLRKKEQLLLQQSRMAAMGEMLGNIAHQWRQPLNALGLKVQELGLFFEYGEFSKERLDANICTAMEILQHLSQTIDVFQNFSVPDKEKSLFRVEQVVAKTVQIIEESLKNVGITLNVSSTGDPQLKGYPNEYSQALMNLILNAKDAFLEQRTANPRITVRSWAENDRTVLTVTDNGGGIKEKIMDKIFDPYFTTKDLGKGTGVGLFLSKTIIEKNMGGRITVRNVEGGSEFRIEV